MTKIPKTCRLEGCAEPARSEQSWYCAKHSEPYKRHMEEVRATRARLGLRREGSGHPGTAIHLLLGPLYERHMKRLNKQERRARYRTVDGWLWPAGMSGKQAAELNHGRD